ncbi:hypothetical protein BH11MYX3_BH11MYX3_02710 [soil metagenome]
MTREQLAECADRDAFAECTPGNRCYEIDLGRACLPHSCGNGFTDPEEQCDDLGNASGDGCSADCLSNESCGNGVIDPIRSESCDDGNSLSHDGCSSRCLIETPRWNATISGIRTKNDGVAIAFDSRRGRLFTFGGTSPGPQGATTYGNGTLERAGGWIQGHPQLSPSARGQAGAAYDENRGVVVLFGGHNGVSYLADTWLWSGSEWTAADAQGPSGRISPVLAYDPVHDRTVMFGGTNKDGAQNDAWELRNGQWTQLPDGPIDAANPSMTFDGTTGHLAVAVDGGYFEFDGGVWTKLGDLPPSVIRNAHWVVYEGATKRLLLLGNNAGGSLHTWARVGQSWTDLARSSVSPFAMRGVVADLTHGGVLGLTPSQVAYWNPDGDLVQSGTSIDQPVAHGAAAANDLRRHQVVLFGGEDAAGTTLFDATWLFDGTLWSMPAPGKRPGARHQHAMAYDPVRDRTVLFGGSDASGVLGDTWIWDGTTWSQPATPIAPAPRASPSLAFDPARGTVVLFGGSNGTVTLDDSWEWDGSTWRPITTANRPAARQGASFTSDPVHGDMILVGGTVDISLTTAVQGRSDTWRLDAGGWTDLAVPVTPTARANGRLTWHPARQRLILSGGETSRSVGPSAEAVAVDDSWEWDGTRWREISAPSPVERTPAGFAAPGGEGVDLIGAVHFQLRWEDGGAYETCETRVDADGDRRIGCDDPDCWSRCSPLCLPGLAVCPSGPTCGDGSCSQAESPLVCASDCGVPLASCGDLVCDAAETCFGDCP